MEMNSLLEKLYANDDKDLASLQKTAESRVLEQLVNDEQATVKQNPYADLSLEELTKLAQELDGKTEEAEPVEAAPVEAAPVEAAPVEAAPVEAEKVAAEEPAETEDAELEKIAFDMLGGQLMAHAMVHEVGLMKVAMSQGLCRVCKTNSMDVHGSTVCAECLGVEQ